MFAELYIENLALIEKTALLWQPGLNVLSGETGAGKSMLLDAVSLLLGSRAGKEQVRRGAERCRVQGVFLPPFSAKTVYSVLCRQTRRKALPDCIRYPLPAGSRAMPSRPEPSPDKRPHPLSPSPAVPFLAFPPWKARHKISQPAIPVRPT